MRTPLYDEHVLLHARIVDFHGWDLPVWYTGIVEEHMATRQGAGLFDISHMGELYVRGPGSVDFLERVLTITVADLKRSQAKYALLLNEQGGIIDDLLTYCIDPGSKYMLCVNASNAKNDLAWLQSQSSGQTTVEDRSPQTVMLALQGPRSADIIKHVLDVDLEKIRYFNFMEQDRAYGALMISRTGYTGSDGVEIFMPPEKAARLWRAFLDQGALPCGLGARDTLRLEMGYPLHGNDIDETTTPIEAGLSFAVDMHKPSFVGKPRLEDQLRTGVDRRLTGLIMIEKGIPREGFVCRRGEKTVGRITSGSISPMMRTGIALAYLDKETAPGDEVEVLIRSKPVKAKVVKPPFVAPAVHKRGT
ncbi:MAG: glycine cleavage system aminomethyltransferase GcvT [Syntrophaceae bacterium]